MHDQLALQENVNLDREGHGGFPWPARSHGLFQLCGVRCESIATAVEIA
jgi:hypothetical protein